jgi:hypothetical protein
LTAYDHGDINAANMKSGFCGMTTTTTTPSRMIRGVLVFG